jgi:hypothetical protein
MEAHTSGSSGITRHPPRPRYPGITTLTQGHGIARQTAAVAGASPATATTAKAASPAVRLIAISTQEF